METISIRVNVERDGEHAGRAGEYAPAGISRRPVPFALRRRDPDASDAAGGIRVDVREEGDEVIVAADLPGVEKEDVSLHLVDPRTFGISCEKKSEQEEKTEGYYLREQTYGSMRRIVELPSDVTEKDARAGFRNGVLEVRFKKSRISPKTQIKIE